MYGSKLRISTLWVILCSGILQLATAASLSLVPADWRPAESDQNLPALQKEGLAFRCDFTQPRDRFVWDLDCSEDWREMDALRVDYHLTTSSAFRAITLYLRSGDGWYAAYLPLREGENTAFLYLKDFEALENPHGMDQISGIRLSPWKGKEAVGTFTLYGLEPMGTRILSVDPDPGTSLNPGEQAYGIERSAWMAGQIEQLGLPVARLPDAEAALSDLSKYSLVILPYNSYPSMGLLDELETYLHKGGKVWVCYSASTELAEMCGFSMQRYQEDSNKTRWVRMAFRKDLWSAPFSVNLPARNLVTVLPADTDASVLANWEDGSGRLQREPAILLSKQAIWITTVLSPGDEGEQRRMLSLLADLLVPKLKVSDTAISRALDKIQRRDDVGVDRPRFSKRIRKIEEARAQEDFFEAWEELMQLQSVLDLHYAETFRAPSFKMRGIWDSGSPGGLNRKWEDCVAEWVSAGITDVFVNVSRSNGNPVRVVKAAENKLSVHAWHICWNQTAASPMNLRRLEREDRLQISPTGDVQPWLCPSHPENVKEEIRMIDHLARTRGLRGVHLDYVRWQDGLPCACTTCKESFAKAIGKTPDWPSTLLQGPEHEAFLKWRALQIDSFVKKVSEEMKRNHPHIKFSIAVWPSVYEVSDRIGQNWTRWVRQGWVDFVVPMNYTEDLSSYSQWLTDQRKEIGRNATLISGIGVSSSESVLGPEGVLQQITMTAERGADGFVLFHFDDRFTRELSPVFESIYGPEAGK